MSATPHATEAVDPRLAIVQDFAARVRRHDPAAEVWYAWTAPNRLDLRTFTDRYLDDAVASAIALEVYATINDHPDCEIEYDIAPMESPMPEGGGFSRA